MSGEEHDSDVRSSGDFRAPFQPADSLLLGSSSRRENGREVQVYLSWGGEIYGPATAEEIAAGIRAAWFEEGTSYWHDGLDEWRDLSFFPVTKESNDNKSWPPLAGPQPPFAPSLQATTTSLGQRKKPPVAKPTDLRSLGFIFGFAFLAVLATVSILMLLMLV